MCYGGKGFFSGEVALLPLSVIGTEVPESEAPMDAIRLAQKSWIQIKVTGSNVNIANVKMESCYCRDLLHRHFLVQ